MSQRKFILNLGLIIFVNLLIKPLYVFGVDRGIQNAVGPESYGLFFALFNLGYAFSILLDPGITSFNNRHIAQDNNALTTYLSRIVPLKTLLSLLYLVCLFAYAQFSNFSKNEYALLSIIAVAHIFNNFVLYFRSNLTALHLFKWDTFISVLDKVLMIIIVGWLLLFPEVYPGFDILDFAIIQAASFFVTAIVAYGMVLKATQKIKMQFNLLFSKSLIKESLPFTLLATLTVIYSKADTLILKEFATDGNKEVGYFAAAYRLIDAFNMIAVLFAGLLYPMFARLLADKEKIEPLMKTAFSLLVVPALFAAFIFVGYANEIMSLLYYAELEPSHAMFRVLAFSAVGSAISYVFGTLLAANGNLKLLNIMAGITALTSIILNVLLVPKFGGLASAGISAFCFLTLAAAQAFFSFKIFSFRLRPSYISRSIIAFLALLGLVWGFSTLNSYWLYEVVALSFLAILLFAVLRLLPFKEMLAILSSKAVKP